MDYTQQEISSMQADRDLDAAIATTFFGWRWMKFHVPHGEEKVLRTGIFPPDAPDRICVPNGHDRRWQPSDRHATRFHEWDDALWWEDDSVQHGFPEFSRDMGAAWTVVQQLCATASEAEMTQFFRDISACVGSDRLDALPLLTPEIICKSALRCKLTG